MKADIMKFTENVDTSELDAQKEKEKLIDEICFLKDQKAALDKCLRSRNDRLRTLMARDGDRKLKIDAGTASFYVQSMYSIHSTDMLCHLFTKKALAGICRPNKAFVEAAKRAGIEVDSAITEGVDERFKVERSRTKAAREEQKAYIEQTAEKFEERIADFQKQMEEA